MRKKDHHSRTGHAMRRMRVTALVLLFAAFSALPVNALAELVFCFEEDGALHIESVANSDCIDREASGFSSLQTSAVDCHECTDIAISSISSINTVQRSLQSSDSSFVPLPTLSLRSVSAGVRAVAKVTLIDSDPKDPLHFLATIRILV